MSRKNKMPPGTGVMPPTLPKLPFSKACKGKVKHPSYDAAVMTLKGIRHNRETLQIYECPFCGKFHLGRVYK